MDKLGEAQRDTADEMPSQKWENVVMMIGGDLTKGLNEMGDKGWRPWGVLPRQDGMPPGVPVAFVRPKTLITVVDTMRGIVPLKS